MDFYDVIADRHMVRDFTDQPVARAVLERVLAAGLRAPSNDHMRRWHLVVMTDRDKIEALLKPIPKRLTEKRTEFILNGMRLADGIQREMYADAVPKQHSMLSASGCLVLPFYRQSAPLLKPRAQSSLNGFASIWCCVENILLAATAEGLGAVLRIPMGGEAEHIREVLGHPKDYVLPCSIALGHPAPGATRPAQLPMNPADHIHWNAWPATL